MIPEDPAPVNGPSGSARGADDDAFGSPEVRQEGEMPGQDTHVGRMGGIPDWLVELLEILDQRRVQVMRLALAIVLVGLLVAIVAPDTLAPSVVVGLLVGVAAVAISAAVAFALDSADPVVHGPRHVRASGGELLIHGRNAIDTTSALTGALDEQFDGISTRRYAVVEVGTTHALSDAVAEELARGLAVQEHRVILTDLTEPAEHPGIAEVVLGRCELAQAVQFVGGLTLARLGAGLDLEQARRSIPTFLRNLPPDIDCIVVGLPGGDDLAAVDLSAFDHVFVLAVRGVSRRVDLIAALDLLEPTGVDAQVLLVDPRAPAVGPPAAVAPLVTESDAGPSDPGHVDLDAPSAPTAEATPTPPASAASGLAEPPAPPAGAAWSDVPAPAPTQDPELLDPTAEIRPLGATAPAAAGGAPVRMEPPIADDGLDPDADDRLDLDPDLLAEALAAGEIDVVDEDELGSRAAGEASADTPAATPPSPPTAPPAPPPAPAASEPTPPRPESTESPITRRDGLGPEFRQRLHGQPDDGGPSNLVEPADLPGATLTTMRAAEDVDRPVRFVEDDLSLVVDFTTTTQAPPTWQLAPPTELDDGPIGAADEDDDDPLGMTAALHSFALERMDLEDEDDDASDRGLRG